MYINTVNQINVNIADGDAASTAQGTDFGDVLAQGSNSDTRTFFIANGGVSALVLTSTSVTGTNAADFSVGSFCGCSLDPGESATFTISVDPSALGARSATINIVSNDADRNPMSFSVAATGAGKS